MSSVSPPGARFSLSVPCEKTASAIIETAAGAGLIV